MYAVIFRAEVSHVDDEYLSTAIKLRDLALREYGCKEFISTTDGTTEVAISYWDNESQIKEWKRNLEHRLAQSAARSKWYKSYSVEVAQVVRSYSSTV